MAMPNPNNHLLGKQREHISADPGPVYWLRMA